MKPATYEFLRRRFSAYYNGEVRGAGAVFFPESLKEREWGFLFFNKDNRSSGMRRHLSFTDAEEVSAYLRSMTPAHVYYSSAYYARPGAAQMNDKQWLGADLIFDLDADHILRGPYDQMLERIKEELFKLIGMLTTELGFSEKDLKINFSGGRGYHLHIPLLSVRGWDSKERRELVNYVSGTGLLAEHMLTGPAGPNSWKMRYRSAVSDELSYLASLDESSRAAYFAGLNGLSEKQVRDFLKNLEGTQKIAITKPSFLTQNKVIQSMLAPDNASFQKRVRESGAQVDEPVTTDIKRLIRHPGSLHGGSGMRVTPLEISRLDEFDPLIDAVVFGDRTVPVDCAFSLSMPILGNRYELNAGLNTVPEALAIFLCARGIAEISRGV